MKFILPLCFSLFLIKFSFANSNFIKPVDSSNIIAKTIATKILNDGIALYQQGRNQEALIKFREASEKDPGNWKSVFYISKISYDQRNYPLALSQIKSAFKIKDAVRSGDLMEQYARSLHRLGKIDSAMFYYNKAKSLLSKSLNKELQVELHIQQCEFAKKEMASGKKSKRKTMSRRVNSKFHEYAPIICDSGKVLYFTSRRSDTKGKSLNPADQQYFEDIYIAKWNPKIKDWDSTTNKIKKFNSRGFDALTYISPDFKKGLLTVNTEACVKVTTRGSDIFETKKGRSGIFSTPRIIKNKTINTTFFEGSATMTADGKTMYFVTDRNYEKKATDLWVVNKEGRNWGKAKALPDIINTSGRETTPYISADGKYLFFSSNGHVGMGGFDIYVSSKNKKGEWSKPINLGSIVNTVNDDTHFQYYPELKKAVMASLEVKKGKSNIDIYEVDMKNFTLPKK